MVTDNFSNTKINFNFFKDVIKLLNIDLILLFQIYFTGYNLFDAIKDCKNQEKQSTSLSEERLKICFECEHLIFKNLIDQCSLCGCFLRFKTKFKEAKCPLKKW